MYVAKGHGASGACKSGVGECLRVVAVLIPEILGGFSWRMHTSHTTVSKTQG
jgi:hypothetical protein